MCLQWLHDQAIWNIRHPHRLDTKRYQDNQPPPHTMVCCWHTRTSNTGTPSMPQTRNCRAQLCCQLVTEEANAAEDLYDWMPKGARWPWEAETIQLKRGPHQCIPGSLWRNRTLSRDLPHHPSKGCPTSCSCSMKVPHHNAAPGVREAGWMAERRNHHPCWRTYRLGIFTGLLP